ncbi:MAG: transporter substrate-binding domain-containing protein [Spongiibacteraceae bacterium]|jgi:polar amino acid transport system substrate-binding protein|nr:transporter substrate-binding domain-containing protein [Spongiibacteraceae bacterium]
MRTLCSFFLLLTSLLVPLSALAESTAAPAAAQPEAAAPRQFDDIRSSGILRVGVHLLAPYAMKSANGGLMGSEIDITRRLAQDLGVEVEYRIYDWDALVPALERGDIDLIAAGLSVTPERALRVWFSNPYASSGISLATNTRLTRDFGSLSDMNSPDVAIAVLRDTVSEQVAREVFGKAAIKTFADEAQVEEALLKGLVHAYVRSEPAPRFLALKHPDAIDVPLSRPLLATREAFALRKGDADLLNFLNAWVVAREADAWLESTHQYWFESLGWRQQVAQ